MNGGDSIGGRIVQMDAFLAFLDHVHGMLTTTYHNTPIMLMASPQWTRPDCETIARYIFEKTRTPSLCMIHSGIATQYGLKWPNLTVIDIGHEKVDVTAIHDGRVVNHLDVGAPSDDERRVSGGEVFTRRLQSLLKDKGFNYDMAEQLKKSTICEVLPYAAAEKNLVELPKENAAKQIAAAPAPVPASADSPPHAAADPVSDAPVAPTAAAVVEDDGDNADLAVENDGVLDVASIVTSGQTKEFLAKKEKEKGKPGRKPKDKDAEAAQAKTVRLPNSKRTHNTFFYEEIIQEEVIPEPKEPVPAAPIETEKPVTAATNATTTTTTDSTNGDGVVAPQATGGAAPGDAPKPEEANGSGIDAPQADAAAAAVVVADVKPEAAETTNSTDPPEFRAKRIRRDIEVGLERFTFADREEIDRISTAIYRTIQGIEDMYMRPACWDNLVFVGNGARLRGLKDNILQTLNARHLISPSTATMFTSELPSNVATPTGTGSQTPTGSFTGVPHQLSSSGVNPLLQAATTASTLGVGAVPSAVAAAAAAAGGGGGGGVTSAGTPQAGSEAAGPASSSSHHFHSQTPTSIKTANLPTYLSEWSKNGFEESMFLGAQVAARIAFCLHSNMDAQSIESQRLMSLSRVDYK